MTEFDPEAFLKEFDIDTRLGGMPNAERPLSSAGAQAQAALLRELAGMRSAVEIMECLVRDYPNNDIAFDALDRSLASNMAATGDALRRLRACRECKGTA